MIARRFYPWTDLILHIKQKQISFVNKFLNYSLLLFTVLFFAFIISPAMFILLRSQYIYDQEQIWRRRGDELVINYRRLLRRYKELKDKVEDYMGMDTPYVNNEVFDTLLTLLHEVGIYDVYLKIGKIRYEQKDNLNLVLVPVKIKAYVDSDKLQDFFRVLNKNLVYQLESMEISWAELQKKERLLLDITVIFKYKPDQLKL